MIVALLVALGLLPPAPPPTHGAVMMIATSYDVPWLDRWNPRRANACGGELDRVTPTIAHRTLPCGTLVLVYAPRTGLATVAEVRDRGPYGLNAAGMDAGPAVTRQLRLNGMEPVLVVVLKRGASRSEKRIASMTRTK